MLTRLAQVKPFALHMPMVTAAAVSPTAQAAIERYLAEGRRKLRRMIEGYLGWLSGTKARAATAAQAQRRLTFLRLRFNAVLSQFDVFADALTQRGEHEYGVWLAGLDAVAADALALPNGYYEAPPVICYLDRGGGAAIRRARTRLPGGGESPVAVVRVPRERMVGSGIASSLVHEVGHQGSALLDLVNSLRPVFRAVQPENGDERMAWVLWSRWISEMVADFWSVAKVGVASTRGLMGVVSLPRAFVFRVNMDDPHPIPWIRVKLSCAIGRRLYPHRQWGELARMWESFYPTTALDTPIRRLLATLEATMPRVVATLVNHRPKALRGNSLMEAMAVQERQPARLAACYRAWQDSPTQMRAARPALAFAVVGQAKADGKITPEDESRAVSRLLRHWAVCNKLEPASLCSTPARARTYRVPGQTRRQRIATLA